MVELLDRILFKDKVVVDILVRKGYSIKEALRLWETSESRKRFMDPVEDLVWVSADRMVEELERELKDDSQWFAFPFE